MPNFSRREMIQRSGVALLGFPLSASSDRELSIKAIVTGGHPDDPETGCGGLIALLSKAGHEVVLAYLTRGEAGIPGATHEEAAKIRTREAENACKILNGRSVFMGQIDGDTYVNQAALDQTFELLNAERPDLLLTHWPIDTHGDHRACSMLTYAAWLRMEEKPDLYFYEVLSGEQTQNFTPTDFVDISAVKPIKREACLAHKSQQMEEWYEGYHGKMEAFRGMESGCAYAEAFVRHWRNPRRIADF